MGIPSQVRFKLDTRESGNLLPVSVYHEVFPDHNMEDLGKTIVKSVHLVIATKSSNSLPQYISEFITSHTLA